MVVQETQVNDFIRKWKRKGSYSLVAKNKSYPVISAFSYIQN